MPNTIFGVTVIPFEGNTTDDDMLLVDGKKINPEDVKKYYRMPELENLDYA